MRVRTYLILLVAVCCIGGLVLEGFVFKRQLELDTESASIAKAIQLKNDTERFRDQLKQLFVSIDLLFGSLETYMLEPSKRQAESVLKLCQTVYTGTDGSAELERYHLRLIHKDVEALIGEINTMESLSHQADFAASDAQLARVDEITYRVVKSVGALEEAIRADIEFKQATYQAQRSEFDALLWLSALTYVFAVLLGLWWSAKSVSKPLSALSESAKQALEARSEFDPVLVGPVEVRQLTEHIDAFIKSLEQKINHNNALINAIPDTLFVLHRTQGILSIKPGVDTPKALLQIDHNLSGLASALGPEQTTEIQRHIVHCLDNQVLTEFDLALEFSGEKRFYEARATPVTTEEAVVVVRDLTDRRQAESRIRHLAYHDGLTGLLNRNAFKQRLTDALQKDSDLAFALLVIDLDRFKAVNDTQGHEVGDRVLQHITTCLRKCLRIDDPLTANLSARFGGDEFVALIRNVEDDAQALRISERLIKAIEQPVFSQAGRVTVTASIGIALHPAHGREVDELINHADLAMFRAKTAGGSRCCVYDHAMGEMSRQKLTMESKLSKALANNELFLVYQPKVNLRTGDVEGAEALVRWRDGDILIPPVEFIPLAEETGLILPLGDFVAATAIQQLAKWRNAGIDVKQIAINVSAPQFNQPEFVRNLVAEADRAGIQYDMVNIEVTESLLMEQFESFVQVLADLRAVGFTIAMDDFGTGYSSLSYIKDLPLDILKIDRTFVVGIEESHAERAIIDAIIQMGTTLGLTIVAEGVETEIQAQYLRDVGCNQAQGYLFSPPLPADQFEAFLARNPRTIGQTGAAGVRGLA